MVSKHFKNSQVLGICYHCSWGSKIEGDRVDHDTPEQSTCVASCEDSVWTKPKPLINHQTNGKKYSMSWPNIAHYFWFFHPVFWIQIRFDKLKSSHCQVYVFWNWWFHQLTTNLAAFTVHSPHSLKAIGAHWKSAKIGNYNAHIWWQHPASCNGQFFRGGKKFLLKEVQSVLVREKCTSNSTAGRRFSKKTRKEKQTQQLGLTKTQQIFP